MAGDVSAFVCLAGSFRWFFAAAASSSSSYFYGIRSNRMRRRFNFLGFRANDLWRCMQLQPKCVLFRSLFRFALNFNENGY